MRKRDQIVRICASIVLLIMFAACTASDSPGAVGEDSDGAGWINPKTYVDQIPDLAGWGSPFDKTSLAPALPTSSSSFAGTTCPEFAAYQRELPGDLVSTRLFWSDAGTDNAGIDAMVVSVYSYQDRSRPAKVADLLTQAAEECGSYSKGDDTVFTLIPLDLTEFSDEVGPVAASSESVPGHEVWTALFRRDNLLVHVTAAGSAIDDGGGRMFGSFLLSAQQALAATPYEDEILASDCVEDSADQRGLC